MTGIYVSIALGIAALIPFLVKCRKQRSVIGVFNKNIVSIFFIATAFFGVMRAINAGDMSVVKYGVIIMFGMAFGILGDIYLDQKWVYPEDNDKYLYAGFIVFLIGHIFYMCSIFIKLSEYKALKPTYFISTAVIAAVIAIGNLILEKPTKQHYGKFKTILVLYAFFVAGTLGASLTAAFVTKGTDAFIPFVVYAVGAVFFLLSDVILSPMYFGDGSKNTPANFIINHVTYYLGQYLFALTIVLFK